MDHRGTAAVENEIAQEKAEALGLAGRRLEAALRDLREYDARAGASADRATRDRLVANAAYRVQNVLIQRESQGLRDAAYVIKFYSVPREVALRIGVRAR